MCCSYVCVFKIINLITFLTLKFDICVENSVVVADHEHDGNELQVTKGFQTHVAKKLGHYLDR